MQIFDEFKNVPPLLPSLASKPDIQRDKGTGGISKWNPKRDKNTYKLQINLVFCSLIIIFAA